MILLEVDIQHSEGKQRLEKEVRGSIGREGGSRIDEQKRERCCSTPQLQTVAPPLSQPLAIQPKILICQTYPLSQRSLSNDLSRSPKFAAEKPHSNHCCCRAIPTEAEAATWATQYRDKLGQRTDLYHETIWQGRGRVEIFYNALPNFLELAS